MGGARSACTTFFAHYNTGDLAAPTTMERNEAMQKVVDMTGSPHWIQAENPVTGNREKFRDPRIESDDFHKQHVHWPDTGANGVGHFHAHKHTEFRNWNETQPDDEARL